MTAKALKAKWTSRIMPSCAEMCLLAISAVHGVVFVAEKHLQQKALLDEHSSTIINDEKQNPISHNRGRFPNYNKRRYNYKQTIYGKLVVWGWEINVK